jgi:AcrR family transcriptional regulator
MMLELMALREQKKRETYLRIQDEAFRLVDDAGFTATTVEEIAAAARVSASTVYRYFGTKEGIFLWDELELPAVELLTSELERQEPIDAVRAALASLGGMGFHISDDEMRQRVRFLYAEPALRAAMGEAFGGFERKLTELFIETGTTDPLAARILAGMTMTVIAAAIEVWTFADPPTSFPAAVVHTMASLDAVLTR